MSVHRYTSWGKTRSPKNIAGPHGTAAIVLDNTGSLTGSSGFDHDALGHATENQRYLHVLVEETNAGSNTNADPVKVYGFSYAFSRWFEVPESEADGHGQNSVSTVATIDPPDVATLPAAHVPGSHAYRVYEIHGIDRVAFVAANKSRVNVFAACSTF